VHNEARDRIARNEALFRQVNERVSEVSQAFAVLDPSPVDFVCECGLEDCTRPIPLTLQQYEAIRAVPTQFVVVPEHVVPEVERTIREGGHYVVVEKLPEEQHVARQTDPRRRL
jgi:hypothetical protein